MTAVTWDERVDELAKDPAITTADIFAVRYRDDPAGFARDCIRWPAGRGLAGYQADILGHLVSEGRASARGPHGLGKSAVAAIAILWFALTRDGEDWKVVTTASAWRQLTRYLWPEVHKWARRINWQRVGRKPLVDNRELQTLALNLTTGQAFAVASDNSDLIEGAHADNLLYVFDEAKAIPGKTFDAAEGAFSGAGSDTAAEAYALAISTPGPPDGRFYEIHKRAAGTEDWWVRHVTLEEAAQAGRISREWAAQRRAQWGEDSALYRNRVLGEFAATDEDGVIPLAWVEAAQERWRELREAGELGGKLDVVALDVADGGADRSTMAGRRQFAVLWIRDVTTKKAGDTMTLAGKVKVAAERDGALAVVDTVGVGAGVESRLAEQDVATLRFVSSAKAKDRRGRPLRDTTGTMTFLNLRAAAWWRVRELLSPESGHNVALPADEHELIDGRVSIADRVVGDLTAPKWTTASNGDLKIEDKDSIRRRLKRSPDVGDVVVMALWPDLAAEEATYSADYLDDDEEGTLLGSPEGWRF